jgi:hypothetical protein
LLNQAQALPAPGSSWGEWTVVAIQEGAEIRVPGRLRPARDEANLAMLDDRGVERTQARCDGFY